MNGEPWHSDQEFPVEDWQAEVAQNDTRLGYAEWVENQRSGRQPTDKPTHPYEPEVRSLCTRLIQAGLQLVFEDGDETVVCQSVDQAARLILGVDECFLITHQPSTGARAGLYLVLGNSPGELVANHSGQELVDRLIRQHVKEWWED